jgi:O-antigen/teichoic acid export membrane protein
VLPAVFILGVIYLVTNALVSDPVWTAVTFAIVLAGVPVYYAAFAGKAPSPNLQDEK